MHVLMIGTAVSLGLQGFYTSKAGIVHMLPFPTPASLKDRHMMSQLYGQSANKTKLQVTSTNCKVTWCRAPTFVPKI